MVVRPELLYIYHRSNHDYIYILRILEFYFMSFYIAIGATCQEGGARFVG